MYAESDFRGLRTLQFGQAEFFVFDMLSLLSSVSRQSRHATFFRGLIVIISIVNREFAGCEALAPDRHWRSVEADEKLLGHCSRCPVKLHHEVHASCAAGGQTSA